MTDEVTVDEGEGEQTTKRWPISLIGETLVPFDDLIY